MRPGDSRHKKVSLLPNGPEHAETQTRTTKAKKLNLWKRIIIQRNEPSLNHADINFWTKKMHYYLYCILLGNGVDSFPLAVRFSMEMSGGFFILTLLFFTFLFGMPMIYMEIFLGKYTRMTNTQMYRMAPLFFGYSLLIFTISTFYIPARATDISLFIIAPLKIVIDPVGFKSCTPKNDPMCYDSRVRGKINDTCVYKLRSFECTKLGELRYVSSFEFSKNFRGDPDIYPLWQYIVACVITWIAMISLCMMGMRILGMLLRGIFILNILIYTIIFVMALTISGGREGMATLIEFKPDTQSFDFYKVLMIGYFTTIKLGLLTPSGHMTYAAYTNVKNQLGPGTECLIITMLNTLLTVYYLAIIYTIAGVLSSTIGINIPQTFVPFVGLYVAMIPEFLSYMESPTIFIILYFLSNWALEVIELTLILYMHILELYDYFPKIAAFPNYVRISFGLLSTIMSFILSMQMMTNSIGPILTLCKVYITQCLLLFIESLMVFYCYGVSRLNDDIHFVTGRRPIKYWRVLWYIYPIAMAISAFVMLLRGYQKDKLPIQNDIQDDLLAKNFYYLAIGLSAICIAFIFVGSFFYIIIGIRASTVIICLLKPQFFWGPPNKEMRIARKQFAPRTSIRSQPPKKKKQRFRPLSIKQMHEKDIAEHVKRGRIFLDSMFFTNIGRTRNRRQSSPERENYTNKFIEREE